MLAAQIQNLQPVNPPPPPVVVKPPQGPGDPWADRDQDPSEFLEDVERIQQEQWARYGHERLIDDDDPEVIADGAARAPLAPITIEISASMLAVSVNATMLPVEVVERGNLIYFVATFAGDPDEVFFSFIRPGEKRPAVDPGYGQPDSKIERVSDGVYVYVLDTTGFSGGRVQWHFWGTGANQASKFGEDIEIPIRSAQLL